MGCKHSLIGDPRWCSQCRGAIARKVTRDEDTGQLLIDGVPSDSRLFQLPPMTPRNVKRGRPKALRAGVAQRTIVVDEIESVDELD
jgi:hypothetical protein